METRFAGLALATLAFEKLKVRPLYLIHVIDCFLGVFLRNFGRRAKGFFFATLNCNYNLAIDI